MQTKDGDWQLRKLKEVYKSYFSAIRARSGEGRKYMLRAFLSVLQHEGLSVERLDAAPDKPFDSGSGVGYLLLNRQYLLDVVRVKKLDERIARECRSQLAKGNFELLVFNFGSPKPEWYPPDEIEGEPEPWTGALAEKTVEDELADDVKAIPEH
jgi:hypothetical protein